MPAPRPHILYLTHDLADPTTRKRVLMLKAGGAAVTLAGFSRGDIAPADIEGCAVHCLGLTYNGRFLQRTTAVLKALVTLSRHRVLFAQADVVLARNLEMLALAVSGKRNCKPEARLIYECLDIHRLMLGTGLASRALRKLEKCLVQHVSLLVTSAPAFIEHYFQPHGISVLPVLLVENKVFDPAFSREASRASAEPWRIGWFGALRCRRSLEALVALAEASHGRIEIILRGRPAYDQLPDFDATVARTRHVHFLGPYRNPEDLAAIYADVHFAWAIDRFEEGMNSRWLLPNRLYEGSLHGAVPIAMRGVATADYLQARSIGVVLDEPLAEALPGFFSTLTPEIYTCLREALARLPENTWRMTNADCRQLVDTLAGHTNTLQEAA